MASADALFLFRWPPSDRALLCHVAHHMIGAGLWQSVESVETDPQPFVQICCSGRARPAYEIGRVPDGRYVLIDRRSDAVSFHDSLAAALGKVAYLP